MLFNSYVYLYCFLPIVIIVYFNLTKFRLALAGRVWLVLSSFFFYAYWNPIYLPLLLSSILVNYGIGTTLTKMVSGSGKNQNVIMSPKKLLAAGILFNLGFLGFYKYADFFIHNVNMLSGSEFSLLSLALPLAISFFTFQQIAYLVDSYKTISKEYDFLKYCLFVSFFPQLIAGPIVHHKEMMPQFHSLRNQLINWQNMASGILLLSIGLFKKVVIADTFAKWATAGFDHTTTLHFIDAWAASLSYTFQIYFDFSGYTDMAIGTAYCFNIKLPLNFNSPYKALNIRDFWRRWHMTLSRWLRDYVYIPLGGNRKRNISMYANIFITFFLGGLWHGAGWTFVLWGVMHGVGSIIHRWFSKLNIGLPQSLRWALTFLFIHFAWVMFRANTIADAVKVYKGMLGLNGMQLPLWTKEYFNALDLKVSFSENVFASVKGGNETFFALLVVLMLTLFAKNSMEIRESFRPNLKSALFVAALITTSTYLMTRLSEFIYFNF